MKDVLISTFVNKNKILNFLEFLKNKFNIKYDKIFVYRINENKNEYLVTFKSDNKEKYLKVIKNSTIMHVKNGCLFSINALNKFIEKENGSVDKDYKVNWDILKNKLLVLANGDLSIESINKIEDKGEFFA